MLKIFIFSGEDEQKDVVIGGEACAWGEYIDETNHIQRIWPRAAVVAEKLWSREKDTKDLVLAGTRLEEHRCRLLERGFPVQPLEPSFCIHSSTYNHIRKFYLENFIYD